MTSRKAVNEPFVDYGEGAEVFVDELATIEEFGSVTYAVFAVRATWNRAKRAAPFGVL